MNKDKPDSEAHVHREQHEPPGQPVLIQAIVSPRGTMNHTYSDFSRVPSPADYRPVTDVDEMTFAEKVHHVLSKPEFENDISWMPHGRAFKVHRPASFEKNICKVYFGHGRYSSFLRQLNNHGFKHISKGADRNCYYHQYMLKDRPHLCQHMPRSKDARRLVADPPNEPNLYRISHEYPLDGPVDANTSSDRREPKVVSKPASPASAVPPRVVPVTAPAVTTASAPDASTTATTWPVVAVSNGPPLTTPLPLRPPMPSTDDRLPSSTTALRKSPLGRSGPLSAAHVQALLQLQQLQQPRVVVGPPFAFNASAPPPPQTLPNRDALLRLAVAIQQAQQHGLGAPGFP